MKMTVMAQKIIGALALLSLIVGGLALAPPTVLAAGPSASKTAACEGIGLTGPDCDNVNAGTKVNSTIESVVNLLSLVVGVVAIIMIIIAGFKYITSGGESSNVSGAKNTLIYAIVGLIIVAAAQVIVRYVIRVTI